MGKALSYFIDEYDALTGYLRDGRYEIDNGVGGASARLVAYGEKKTASDFQESVNKID